MQRHATLTECAILKVADPPPHCGTVLFDKFNEDGLNELCIGSANGLISIFACCDAKCPRATGNVDLSVGESIAVLVSGRFLGEETLIVAITTEGLCTLMSAGASNISPVIGATRVEVPINPSVGVSVARSSSAADVLVVGNTSGTLTVLDFSRHMNGQSNANATASLEHKITAILPLDGPGGIALLACGLDGGSMVVLDWPSLALIGKIPPCTKAYAMDIHPSKTAKDLMDLPLQQFSHCEELAPFSADREGHDLCIVTSNGGLTRVQLSVRDAADGMIEFHQKSLLEKPTAPWIGVTIIHKSSDPAIDTLNSTLAACTADGKVYLVDIPNATASIEELDDGISPHCVIDVASLFTSPLRAFTSGKFTVSRQDHEKPKNDEETCLFFCLSNGEVLVFHSLADQIGSGPIVPHGCDRYLLYPGLRENLTKIEQIEPERTVTHEQVSESLTLNWASSLSQNDLEAIRREISELEQHSTRPAH